MSKKHKFDYFDAFEKQAKLACEEADILIDALQNFTSAADLEDYLERAHEVENKGDQVNHDILHGVAVDFITPIEREDIITLAAHLDNVTDNIEDVLQRFYIYDVHFMHPAALEMAQLIKGSTDALLRAMGDFRNFKKSKKFRQLIVAVNDYEERADHMYLEYTRKLYTDDRDNAVRVEVWSRIFDHMEKTCDSCEAVADTMGNVMLKNV